MFDNLFAFAGPSATAGVLCVALFAVVGACRLGGRVHRTE